MSEFLPSKNDLMVVVAQALTLLCVQYCVPRIVCPVLYVPYCVLRIVCHIKKVFYSNKSRDFPEHVMLSALYPRVSVNTGRKTIKGLTW